jgi:hypothetical protein
MRLECWKTLSHCKAGLARSSLRADCPEIPAEGGWGCGHSAGLSGPVAVCLCATVALGAGPWHGPGRRGTTQIRSRPSRPRPGSIGRGHLHGNSGVHVRRLLAVPAISGQVRSDLFITRPKSRTMRAKRRTLESQQNEGAQMSSELESDRAMVVIELWWRFRFIGADGVQVG